MIIKTCRNSRPRILLDLDRASSVEGTLYWIGLTGGIASGKSTVSELLKKQGYSVVSADAIAYKVVEPGEPALEEIKKIFGASVLNRDGTLNRRTLGQIVFADKVERARLESILHPRIQAEVLRQKRKFQDNHEILAFYDIPLLFENNLEKDFDRTLVVNCSLETQKKRMKARDGLTDDEISKRLKAQIPLSEKVKRADFVLTNEGSEQDLEKNLSVILEKLKEEASKKH